MSNPEINRREFLKLSALSTAVLARFKFPDGPLSPEESSYPEEVKIVEIENRPGILKPSDLPVILLPLRNDHLYDPERQIDIFHLQDVHIAFDNIYTLKATDSQGLRATVLPHVTGERALPVGILDSGTFRFPTTYIPDTKYGEVLVNNNIGGIYTYTAENTPTWFYPNKIFNLLLGSENMITHQRENGPLLRKGKESSLLDLLSIERGGYKPGWTASGNLVRGGGVCPIATILGRSLYQEGATFTQISSHPASLAYFIPPGDEVITAYNRRHLDVTVDSTYDFKWRATESGKDKMANKYLWVEAAIIPNGRAPIGDLDYPADARIFLTVSWRTEPPPNNQAERLEDLRETYWQYHQTGDKRVLVEQSKTKKTSLGKCSFWISTSAREIAEAVYPESSNNFQIELESDPYLSEIKILADRLNKYADTYTYDQFWSREAPGAGEYLRQSSWYQNLGVKKAQIEPALSHLDQNSFLIKADGRSKDQATQCIGWTVLLSSLGDESSPKSIGGANITTTSQLVPDEIINGTYNYLSRHGYSFKVVDSLDQVNPGDQYVLYNGAGHIGAVVDKKEIDGQIILLVADANRHSDGRIHIFEVTDGNFDAVFGQGRKVVMKGPNS